MNKQSVQLAEYISFEKAKIGKNQTPGAIIKYKRLDDGKDKILTVQYFIGQLDENSGEVLKTLKEGGPGTKFVVVKEEGGPRPQGGNYWNLKEFRHADTFVWKTYTNNYNNNNNNNNNKSTYDNLGQQIGNSMTNAVNSLGVGKSIDEYKQRALEFVLAKDWIREQVTKQKQETQDRNNENQQAAMQSDVDQYTEDNDDDIPF